MDSISKVYISKLETGDSKTTNALPRWRLNVETKTKRTLHSSFTEPLLNPTTQKNLVLNSSHFALN